jgi:hypothetical protein
VVSVLGRTSTADRAGARGSGKAVTIAWVSSSCNANTSAMRRSYESDQS